MTEGAAIERVSEERAGPRFWLLLALPLLVFSAVYSQRAPCGNWRNRVLGVTLSQENDPTGYYIASAHELFTSEHGPLFPGHPGTTLQLLLFGLQRSYFAVAGDDSLGFTEFTARNIAQVTVLSKMLATLLHVASGFFLFHFARRLLGGARGAVLATVGYLTSFPVLYYLSRVSVEPLMVLFFTGTFLALWACRRELEQGRTGRGAGLAALAGASAISGLVTKLHFLGPLPLFALLHLLASAPREKRVKAATAYVVAAFATLAFYSTVIDWEELIRMWRAVGQIHEVAPSATPIRDFALFPLTEALFLVLAVFGLMRFVRRYPAHRRQVLWVGVYVLYSFLIWGYRVVALWNFRCFHYLFLVMVFLAPFFGYAAAGLLERLRLRPLAAGLGAGVLVAVVHGVAIWSVFDARAYDTEQYRIMAEVHELTPSLGPRERVVLLDQEGRLLFRRMGSTGLSVSYAPGGGRSRLIDAYQQLFSGLGNKQVPATARRGTLGVFGAYAVIGSP